MGSGWSPAPGALSGRPPAPLPAPPSASPAASAGPSSWLVADSGDQREAPEAGRGEVSVFVPLLPVREAARCWGPQSSASSSQVSLVLGATSLPTQA